MTESIQYHPLGYSECEKIRQINTSQYIGRAWREVDGVSLTIQISVAYPKVTTKTDVPSVRKPVPKFVVRFEVDTPEADNGLSF